MGDGTKLPWVLRQSRTVLALAAAALAGALVLLSRFELDPNVEHLLPDDEPTLELTRRLQGVVPLSRQLLVVLRAGKGEDLAEKLPAVAEALRASPHVTTVRATREEFAGQRVEWFKQAPAAHLPPESLGRLQDRLAGPGRRTELESALRRIAEDPLAGKAVVLRDPLGTRWIFEEAAEALSSRFPARLRPGTPYLLFDEPPVALVLVSGQDHSFVVPFSRALLADVRSRIGAALSGSTVRFELAGGYVSAEWQEGAMRRDMTLQTITSAFLVVGFLAWFTRSFLAAHLILVPVALAIICALAWVGAAGPLTPLVVSAAAVLIAQGIDFPVHLFARFRAERAAKGRDEAIGAALGSLGRPLLGACLTTVAAFLSLTLSDFPGFFQFGNVLFLGLSFCLLASMTVFPSLLRLVDGAARRPAQGVPWVVQGAASLGPARRWAAGLIVLAGLAGWGVTLARGVRVNLDLRKAMAPGDPGMKALENLERDLGTSITPVYALVDASVPLESLRGGVERLRREGVVGAADGPHSLVASPEALERLAKFRRATEGWRQGTLDDMSSLGFRPEPFRPALDALERLIAADPAGIDALVHPPFGVLRAGVIHEGGGRKEWLLTLMPPRSLWEAGDRARFDDAARAALGRDVRFYGAFHLPDYVSGTLGKDLLRVTALTVGAVIFLTLVAVGSVVDGLRALVPVTLAVGVTFGLAVLLGGTINPMNLVAFPLIVGIGVDGGIHFMCRLRQDARRDRAGALLDVGPGVWGSTATTLLGFGSIAFSSTPGLVSMGVLVAGGAAASLLATLVVLPALVPESVEPRGVPRVE